MSIATDLRKMRDYIAANGFSPEIGRAGCARCFVGASDSALGFQWSSVPLEYMADQMEIDVDEYALRRQGWRKRDAIAALEIAEACAIEEGR